MPGAATRGGGDDGGVRRRRRLEHLPAGVCAATLLVLCLSVAGMAGHRRETEFYTLLLFAALGAVLLGGTRDLLLLAVGYLLSSIPAYALVGFG